MNILYIGYWNLNDPLTAATIFPGLRFIRELEPNGTILFINIQREQLSTTLPGIFDELNIVYKPILSGDRIADKIRDFWQGPAILESLCSSYKISQVIARGAPAGALAYLLWKKNRLPYLVESFEPHADYMRYSGTWHRFDLRYLFQKYWEERQKRTAQLLVVVSENYRKQLLEEGIDAERIKVAPCGCDPRLFYPSEKLRIQVRSELGIPDSAIVGIYAGKFGGLYEEHMAFKIFQKFFTDIPDFHLILLSSASKAWVQENLNLNGISSQRVSHVFVPHEEVNGYLNAADFGFALYKSNAVSPFLSPVKIGEYWASGLPVVMLDKIGDESAFVDEQQLGSVIKIPDFFDDSLLDSRIRKLLQLNKSMISERGLSIRAFEKLSNAYKQVLS